MPHTRYAYALIAEEGVLEGNNLLVLSFHVRKNNERVLNASSVRNEQNVPNVRSNFVRRYVWSSEAWLSKLGYS